MQLLERDKELAVLSVALSEAATGHGRLVLVRGEAGIGKTSLVRTFVEDQTSNVSVLWGACDDLSTPRPLGPFWEMTSSAAELDASLAGGEPADLFATILSILDRRLRPTLMVVEDIHWADAATLDVLRYVGRRVAGTHGLLILTYRTLESADDKILKTVASFPADSTSRVDLEPLSPQAIAELAARFGRSSSETYRGSGGNPFLLTEMLAIEDDSLPATVRDAVMARAAALGPDARRIVELVAVIPTRTERRLLEKILGPDLEHLTDAERHGLLVVTETDITFRHEVARRAMEATLPGSKRQALNQMVLEALIGTDATPARLVHHALASGDRVAVAQYAPIAARQAAGLGSHREAVENYRLLVDLLPEIDSKDRAGILADWAWEEWTVGAAESALHRALEASRLWQELGDPAGVSNAARVAVQALWGLGDMSGAEEAATQAVEVLDSDLPSVELAAAYGIQSWVGMHRHDMEMTVMKADAAIEVAREVGTAQVEAHALNNKGVVIAGVDFEAGIKLLEQSYQMSRSHGLDQEAIRAAANLADAFREERDLTGFERWLVAAAELTEASASARFELHLTGRRADLMLLRGSWEEAERCARTALASALFVAPDRTSPLTVLGVLAARRETEDPFPLLSEAVDTARTLESMERLAPAVAGLAEASFLTGNLGSIRLLVGETHEAARRLHSEWSAAELEYWLWKAGELDRPPSHSDPYRLQIMGQWKEAAADWSSRGFPYQQAMALAEGDTISQIASLSIFDELGATATAGMVRRRLHQLGVTGVPRAPRSPRKDSAGLTARHHEVLELMRSGYSNPEIASLLFISAKTVEHHVSAILSRLGVSNRREAVRVARERGILASSDIEPGESS